MAQDIHATFLAQMSMPKAELDHQLSPSLSAKDAAGTLADMIAATQAAKTSELLEVTSDIAYGRRPRQRLDVFRPANASAPLPCFIFVHGGFWQEGDKSVSGFAARTFAGLGWAYVSVGYTLTPEFTLSALMAEVHDAVSHLHANAHALGIDPTRLVLAGHSAGGHIAASIVCGMPGPDVSGLLAGAVLISGVFELGPIARSYVSDLTPMTDDDVVQLSPIRRMPCRTRPIHVLIGADEPDAFHVQSDALVQCWHKALPGLTRHTAVGRDHFDVLWELTDPNTPTLRHILSMV